jgi:NAD(P)-dependent dehydrogenase (short-subunit alcohol dehydrogenase family)
MHTTWRDKTAFLTGGGSGIGRALALAMTKRGARVLVTDIDEASAMRTVAECGSLARGRALDVRDAAGVQTAIEDACRENGRLDYVFNNAGIGMAGEADEIPLVAWERIIDVNLRGVIHGVLAAYPLMLNQGFGHIINTASLAGLAPSPLLTPYSMTKHAVVGLSASLRIEAAAHGVRVSVLCPSAIETPILDKAELPGLPKPVWIPNIRRYLSRVAGPPWPVNKLAEEALDAIGRNRSVIVIPARARLAWRMARLLPRLVESSAAAAVQTERADRK